MEQKRNKVPYFKSELIAEKTWMISNAFLPSTPALCYLLEGRDYALLIDSIIGLGNLRAFCETLTGKPIRLVNTHAHSDHTGGNFQFDACWMHHRDIRYFQDSLVNSKQDYYDYARRNALPEYREMIEPDGSFVDDRPMRVYPLYDGDVFDLGGRRIEVAEAGGHTPGSIVLIDPGTRIAFTGDACNGNTLLEFDNCLPVAAYMRTLLRLRERRDSFDRMYGGHEIFGADLLDEAIETVARVLAGTDDKYERTGMTGEPVLYAARKVEGGYARADGKRFNMSYRPENVWGREERRQVITGEERAPE